MRKIFNLLFCLSLAILPLLTYSQSNFDIIPKPNQVRLNSGLFTFPRVVSVKVSPKFKEAAQLLTEHLAIDKITYTGNAQIHILQATLADKIDKDAYLLQITNSTIILKAWDIPQIINGIYTLVQLGYLQNDFQKIQAAVITDKPSFSYRGLHLDVSRHFVPVSFIKKYIDIMAIYKFNNFHWHFTDGAGWRIEIKKYPELTQKAAWRSHAVWKDWWFNGRQYLEKGHPNASGGYYTQEEAKELVAYAAKKGINIIPEIEMPGHSEEVIAVFPELSCTGDHTLQGEFCIGNPKTFEFLTNVLDEILEIFPSKLIHIGGDEANKSHWKNCPKDLALMKAENLHDVEQLQSYAIRKMDKYLQAKGRKLIGWDEILEGGLSEGATVMSWRGEQGGINAANAGHDVIMTPGSHLYFDSYQTDPRTQPEAIGGYLTLEKVYSYHPIPSEISEDKKKHILGAQANIWCEYVTTPQHVEYMVFPRALALSEVNWTPKEEKSWADFQKRLQSHYKLLQDLNVNYYRPSYNVDYKSFLNPETNTYTVSLTTEQLDSTQIYYTLDGSEPSLQSNRYTQPFKINKPTTIKAAYFIGKIKMGPVLSFDIDIHKAMYKRVTYNNPWEGYPAQKEATLTNGIKGGLSYHDGQWQAFSKPLDVIIDLEEITSIQSVAMNFMQISGPGVFMPGEFKVQISDDGKNFKDLGIDKNTVSTEEYKLTFKKFEVKSSTPTKARFVRVIADNPQKGYIFTDEVIIY